MAFLSINYLIERKTKFTFIPIILKTVYLSKKEKRNSMHIHLNYFFLKTFEQTFCKNIIVL